MSQGKEEMRKALASLSFTEKIKILGRLRERSLSLAQWGLRRKSESEREPTRVKERTSTNRTTKKD
jgi:hypothetical protein